MGEDYRAYWQKWRMDMHLGSEVQCSRVPSEGIWFVLREPNRTVSRDNWPNTVLPILYDGSIYLKTASQNGVNIHYQGAWGFQ